MVITDIIASHVAKTINCRNCGSALVAKYGFTEKQRQRYLCLNCNRTFLNNDAPRKMRYSAEAIASAIEQFYEGRSLNEIQQELDTWFNILPHYSTIRDWVFHYTWKAVETMEPEKIETGDTWVADEIVVKFKSKRLKNIRIFDCIDARTGFILASQIIADHSVRDVTGFLSAIEKRVSGKQPAIIITDRLRNYLKSSPQNRLPETGHHERMLFTHRNPGDDVKRLLLRLEDRTNVLRNLTSLDSIGLVMQGWAIHHNYFHAGAGSDEITPALAAGAIVLSRNWMDVVCHVQHETKGGKLLTLLTRSTLV